MSVNLEELRSLSPAEKLKLIELLCDDLAGDDESPPIPEWALTEAGRRLAELKARPDEGIPLEEMLTRIRHG